MPTNEPKEKGLFEMNTPVVMSPKERVEVSHAGQTTFARNRDARAKG
jgi:hypothetical protein